MSGTTTPSGGASAPPAALDLGKLLAGLKAKPGRAGGRTKDKDVLTALQKARRVNDGAAEALRLLQAGAQVPADSAAARALAAAGVDAAALADAAAAPAQPAAPAGSATGALTLAANNGTGAVTVPGQALGANAPGYWADVHLFSRGADGARVAATARVVVGREAADAFAAVAVTNHFGGVFGTAGTAGISVTLAATCAADGATATLSLTNTGTAARSVAYAVQRRVAG